MSAITPNHELAAALLQYAKVVHSGLVDGTIEVRETSNEAWRRGTDRVARKEIAVERSIGSLHEAEASGQYADALRAVRDDQEFGPLDGGMIGDLYGGQMRFDAEYVVRQIVHGLRLHEGASRLNVEAAIARSPTQREIINREAVSAVALAPLPGVRSSLFPFQIDEGVVIDELSDEEINACAKTGTLRPLFPSMTMFGPDECVGVRIELSSPSVRSLPGAEPAFAPNEFALAPHHFGKRAPYRWAHLVEDVLFILRLAKHEFVTAAGSVHFQTGHMGTSFPME